MDPKATGTPAIGMPVTDTKATGPKLKVGTRVKPKGSTPVKPKHRGKGKKSKSESKEGKPETGEQGKPASEGYSVHLTRGQRQKIEEEEKKKKMESLRV